MIVGDGTYELVGTDAQQAILAPVFDSSSESYIGFPWGKLSPPHKPIPIGWDDLNGGGLAVAISWNEKSGGGHPEKPLGVAHHEHDPLKIPGHVHLHDEFGNEGHGILRQIDDARWWIAGVFWTDGRIYVDTRCSGDMAREVVAAEIAHSVDYFLPLSDAQHVELMKLWHHEHGDVHTWWEIHDYGDEYYTLGGEAFMAAFTVAYSKIVPDQSAFAHKTTSDMAARIREIVGVPLAGAPPPEPVKVWRIGKGRRFHRYECWVAMVARTFGRELLSLDVSSAFQAGLTPCRICKPS
jgi:hypothetical protein